MKEGTVFNDCILPCHFTADQIEHKKQTMETFMLEAACQPAIAYPTSSTSPKFARGIGLHVDDYMKMEMEAKKRKEMEHRVSADGSCGCHVMKLCDYHVMSTLHT